MRGAIVAELLQMKDFGEDDEGDEEGFEDEVCGNREGFVFVKV